MWPDDNEFNVEIVNMLSIWNACHYSILFIHVKRWAGMFGAWNHICSCSENISSKILFHCLKSHEWDCSWWTISCTTFSSWWNDPHEFLKWLDQLLNVITTMFAMFLAFLLLGKDGQTSIGVPQNSLFFLGDSDIPNIFCDWMLLVWGKVHICCSATILLLYVWWVLLFHLSFGTPEAPKPIHRTSAVLGNGAGQPPKQRSLHASIVVGDCLYIFGGCPEDSVPVPQFL